jgi:uncharacterized protein (UPF0548 family)
MQDRLRPFEADRLREAPLTYAEVGRSLAELPGGFHHLVQTYEIGRGRAAFNAAGDELMRWGVQRRAGLQVSASWPVAEVGAVAIVRLGRGFVSVDAPVRVVAVVDEDDRRGFAYGTLPGHPDCGEESFVVAIGADGKVTLGIVAFSRPGNLLARCLGPVGTWAQRVVTRRYGRALDPVAKTL